MRHPAGEAESNSGASSFFLANTGRRWLAGVSRLSRAACLFVSKCFLGEYGNNQKQISEAAFAYRLALDRHRASKPGVSHGPSQQSHRGRPEPGPLPGSVNLAESRHQDRLYNLLTVSAYLRLDKNNTKSMVDWIARSVDAGPKA
jgi:hypothetical protein